MFSTNMFDQYAPKNSGRSWAQDPNAAAVLCGAAAVRCGALRCGCGVLRCIAVLFSASLVRLRCGGLVSAIFQKHMAETVFPTQIGAVAVSNRGGGGLDLGRWWSQIGAVAISNRGV